MGEVFLSVVIPVYNPTILEFEKCIDSIKKITVPMEIIVIDDGSNNEQIHECIKYTNYDERIQWIRKKNAGVSSARNTGIQIAAGKYILFVDADDELTETFIQFFNTNYLKISGEWVLFDVLEYYVEKKRENIRRLFDVNEENFNIIDIKWEDVFDLCVNSKKMSECWGKLVLRSVLLENRVVFPEGVLSGEDTIFNNRLLYYIHRIQYIPIIAYLYHYIPRLSSRVLKDPYKRYEHLTMGRMELERVLKAKVIQSKWKEYIEEINNQYVETITQDCFILCTAGKFDKSMKRFLQDWMRDNHIWDGLSIVRCSGIKRSIYYLIMKYRLWFAINIIVKLKKIVR